VVARIYLTLLHLAQATPVPQGWGEWLVSAGIAGVLAGVLYMVVFSGKLRPEREVLDLQARLVAQQAITDLANQRAEFAEKAAEHIIGSGAGFSDLVTALKAYETGQR